MCGLFGWYLKPGEFTLDEKGKMVEELVLRSDLRGGDSWGLACPTANRRYEIYKDLGTLGKHKMFDRLAAFDVVYGHTRSRTSGDISRKNAHPFQVNHIIGAHNGTIANREALNRKYHRNCAVDSQHIFYHLSERKSLEELAGWGAFWWFRRSQPETLSLFKENLHNLAIYGIGTPDNTLGVIFASDDRVIEDTLEEMGRPGFPYQFYPNLEYQISSWQGLNKTDHQMRFQPWGARAHSEYTPQQTRRIVYKHLTRTERNQHFISYTKPCDLCGHRFFMLFTLPPIGRVCMDCFDLVGG